MCKAESHTAKSHTAEIQTETDDDFAVLVRTVQKIDAMTTEHVPHHRLAERMGETVYRIEQARAVIKTGAMPKPMLASDWPAVSQMLGKGMTYAQIGMEYGQPRSRVGSFISRMRCLERMRVGSERSGSEISPSVLLSRRWNDDLKLEVGE